MTWYLHNTAQEFTEDMIGGAFGMAKNNTPERYYTYVSPALSVVIMKPLRYLADMHYCLKHTIINGSVVRFVKTI